MRLALIGSSLSYLLFSLPYNLFPELPTRKSEEPEFIIIFKNNEERRIDE